MSTFHGLEMAKRALFAQQGALYTTGHNISNVNTSGYSRQRAEFVTTKPYPVPSRVQPHIAGQLGTGVKIGTVERVRDQFLDAQYRAETSKYSYWNTMSEALSRMEELINEPSENGLSRTMDQFWQSLQELATNPDNDGARAVVAERGLAVAETFNYLSKSLQAIQGDLKDQIEKGTVEKVNSLLDQIADVNDQIQKLEPHGYLPNDLYDDRDRLIDELSEIINIKVTYSKSSNSPNELEIADGLASIEIVDESGKSFDPPVKLIEAYDPDNQTDQEVNKLEIDFDDTGTLVSEVRVGSTTVFDDEHNDDMSILGSIGSFTALIEANGYVDEDGNAVGVYPEMLAELDKLAKEFAEAFNAVHSSGFDMNGDEGKEFFVRKDEFDGITAESITVASEILDDPNLIAAAVADKGSRNGENALELTKVFDNENIDGLGTSPRKFLTALVGQLGVDAQRANRMTGNTGILRDQVDHSRRSVSAVSLDEEISNLIKFQHAYNAAARNMTAVDELIDRVINQMGLVGR